MTAFGVAAVGLAIAATAFIARIVVHVGRTPGGVDTWYYLAYARAVRRHPSLDVRLPQYLLQDEVQSYPPLFPTLLALLPHRGLDRAYWAVSPAIDCVHLLLLYGVTFRLTGSVVVGAIAAATYAFTPHLVSETRSLSARPFGALLHSAAVLLLLKAVLSEDAAWAALAILAGAMLFLSSAAMAAAYTVVCGTLSFVFADGRYALCALAALVLAFVLSGGRMARVVRNYVFAVEYWRRNRRLYGAHPLRHSPIYGDPAAAGRGVRPGFLGRTHLHQVARLLGENPFLIALVAANHGDTVWEQRLYAWAMTLAALSVVATVVPPLRAFGPGRAYMKAAIFPTAYTLAYAIGGAAGFARPFGILVLACLGVSLLAIAFFCLYVRRRPTEQTASVPAGLETTARALHDLPPGGVMVMPYMYADYVGYRSGHAVLWGAHCGNLERFEWIAPVVSRPLPEMFMELGVRYVLLDARFADPAALRLEERLTVRAEAEGFTLYEYAPGARRP